MGNSLQDQLLKAGLVDKDKANKANKAKKQKNKQARQQRRVKGDNTAESGQRPQGQSEKASRDRELNQQRNEVRRQREIAAQVKQLVVHNRVPRSNDEDDKPFYFENKGKVKQLYVSAKTHALITSGKLLIVNFNGVFELVPPEIGEKIRQRNPSLVIDLPKEQHPAEDDPYADYQVPDDLMW